MAAKREEANVTLQYMETSKYGACVRVPYACNSAVDICPGDLLKLACSDDKGGLGKGGGGDGGMGGGGGGGSGAGGEGKRKASDEHASTKAKGKAKAKAKPKVQ